MSAVLARGHLMLAKDLDAAIERQRARFTGAISRLTSRWLAQFAIARFAKRAVPVAPGCPRTTFRRRARHEFPSVSVAAVPVGFAPEAFGLFIGPLNPNAIPTLSEWGLILAGASLLGLGAWQVTRTGVARVPRS